MTIREGGRGMPGVTAERLAAVPNQPPSGGHCPGLVVAVGIDGELASERAVVTDDADVAAGDQQCHRLVLAGATEADVAQAVATMS